MSRLTKIGMVALVATGLSATFSNAADIDPPIIEHHPIAVGGSFYLRGDVGYSIWKDPDLAFRNDVAGFSTPFNGEDADNALVIGGGVGYKFNKHLRADLTFDVRTNKDINATVPCGACQAFASIPDRTLLQNTDLDLYTFFANAYVDIGTYNGVTPYVGGGVGAAYLNYGSFLSLNNPTANNSPGAAVADLQAANPSGVENQVFRGEDGFRFAWNLQAGLTYDINDHLALDGSYRYVRVLDGDVAPDIGGVGAVVSNDLVGHEIRLGLRYTFGGKSDYEPEPIFK